MPETSNLLFPSSMQPKIWVDQNIQIFHYRKSDFLVTHIFGCREERKSRVRSFGTNKADNYLVYLVHGYPTMVALAVFTPSI